jgi:hypothetical protein
MILVVVCSTVALMRLALVSWHVNARIDEVYQSKNWRKYPIDINRAYDRDIWNLRKWSYRSFFPEAVK